MIKSEAEIYQVLEGLLKKAGDTPQTCADLYDDPRVKELSESANRVSDYLGHMWRRGVLQRWYAAKNNQTRSRYAYTWLEAEETEPQPIDRLTVVRGTKKPNVTVTENDGSVVLDFPEFTITVVRK
jgi:hypothetical protein